MTEYKSDEIINLYKSLQVPFSWENVDTFWQIYKERPSHQVEKKLLDLIHLGIVVAKELSYSMIHSSKSYPVLVSLMTQIALTIESIYATAVRDMHFQSQILLRSLFELETIFLAIVLNKEKRSIYENPTSGQKEKWYRHFRFPKLMKVIKEYEAKTNMPEFSNWIERRYSELSSFTHADILVTFPYSFNYLMHEDGKYGDLGVADVNEILKDTIYAFVLFSTLFFTILDSNISDLRPSYLYGGESIERPSCYFWMHAKSYSNILRKECINFYT